MPAHPNDINEALVGVHAREIDDAPYTDAEVVVIATPYVKGPARALWVGGLGNVDLVLWPSGTAVLFTAVPAGTLLKVASTDTVVTTTTASAMVALY